MTKSASITSLDTIPAAEVTAGKGAKGRFNHIGDFLTAPVTTGSYAFSAIIHRFCRIPTTAIVKAVLSEGAAQTQGSYDIGLFYSDSTVDGTAVANQGLVVSGAAAFFASAQAFSSAVPRTDITNESGSYTVDKRNMPIWKAAGLSADPGGYFDVCATATNTVTVGGLMGVEVAFVGD